MARRGVLLLLMRVRMLIVHLRPRRVLVFGVVIWVVIWVVLWTGRVIVLVMGGSGSGALVPIGGRGRSPVVLISLVVLARMVVLCGARAGCGTRPRPHHVHGCHGPREPGGRGRGPLLLMRSSARGGWPAAASAVPLLPCDHTSTPPA
jgi:hypothetical protein